MTLQKGEYGIDFVVRFMQDGEAKDVSSATTRQIIWRSPTGVVVTKAAVFVSSGTDGRVKYPIVSGDMNEAGLWSAQGIAVGTTFSWKTRVGHFYVGDNLV